MAAVVAEKTVPSSASTPTGGGGSQRKRKTDTVVNGEKKEVKKRANTGGEAHANGKVKERVPRRKREGTRCTNYHLFCEEWLPTIKAECSDPAETRRRLRDKWHMQSDKEREAYRRRAEERNKKNEALKPKTAITKLMSLGLTPEILSDKTFLEQAKNSTKHKEMEKKAKEQRKHEVEVEKTEKAKRATLKGSAKGTKTPPSSAKGRVRSRVSGVGSRKGVAKPKTVLRPKARSKGKTMPKNEAAPKARAKAKGRAKPKTMTTETAATENAEPQTSAVVDSNGDAHAPAENGTTEASGEVAVGVGAGAGAGVTVEASGDGTSGSTPSTETVVASETPTEPTETSSAPAKKPRGRKT